MTEPDILTKQVEQVLPGKEGLLRLMKKRKIRVYLGVDPTAPDLHLGHAIPLRKLAQFQRLGHETILLFGTFTAQIGDPSGRDEERKPLSLAEIKKNMATYQKQAGKVLDLKKTKVRLNGDWLGKLKFKDVLEIASRFTVSQLLERDMFQRRMKKGKEVWVHELLYPFMQGYDSVAMNVDLEIGATDQTFNMLVGRKLQEAYHGKEKFVLTTPLLLGLDGRKMSKSYGNAVDLLDKPNNMYGKLMTLRDELVPHYFELCTDISLKEAAALQRRLSPRDLKARLAREIVGIYHGAKAAKEAESEFEKVFVRKEIPSEMKTLRIKRPRGAVSTDIVDVLLQAKMAPSKSQARRLVQQGGVKFDGRVINSSEQQIVNGGVLQVGKRHFVKVVYQS